MKRHPRDFEDENCMKETLWKVMMLTKISEEMRKTPPQMPSLQSRSLMVIDRHYRGHGFLGTKGEDYCDRLLTLADGNTTP